MSFYTLLRKNPCRSAFTGKEGSVVRVLQASFRCYSFLTTLKTLDEDTRILPRIIPDG